MGRLGRDGLGERHTGGASVGGRDPETVIAGDAVGLVDEGLLESLVGLSTLEGHVDGTVVGPDGFGAVITILVLEGDTGGGVVVIYPWDEGEAAYRE